MRFYFLIDAQAHVFHYKVKVNYDVETCEGDEEPTNTLSSFFQSLRRNIWVWGVVSEAQQKKGR